MDYDATGTLLVTSSDDETLRLYSTETATSRKVLFSKKYGIDLVRFTHSQDAVICASKNNWDGLQTHTSTPQHTQANITLTAHLTHKQRRSGTCRCTTTRTCATSGGTGTACSRCACRRRRTRS